MIEGVSCGCGGRRVGVGHAITQQYQVDSGIKTLVTDYSDTCAKSTNIQTVKAMNIKEE